MAVRRALRGWASLRPRSDLPSGLEGPAATALTFIEERGRLRLFGSWREKEVRVGLNDPAGLVDEIEAWAVHPDGSRARLTLLGETPDGRGIYRVDGDVSPKVLLQAHMRARRRRVVVAETILRRDAIALPSSPSPPAYPAAAAPVPAPSDAAASEAAANAPVPPSSGLTWWWMVVGIAAVGLAGTAVVFETQ